MKGRRKIINYDIEIEFHDKHKTGGCITRPMTPEEIKKYGEPIYRITDRKRDIKFLRREIKK